MWSRPALPASQVRRVPITITPRCGAEAPATHSSLPGPMQVQITGDMSMTPARAHPTAGGYGVGATQARAVKAPIVGAVTKMPGPVKSDTSAKTAPPAAVAAQTRGPACADEVKANRRAVVSSALRVRLDLIMVVSFCCRDHTEVRMAVLLSGGGEQADVSSMTMRESVDSRSRWTLKAFSSVREQDLKTPLTPAPCDRVWRADMFGCGERWGGSIRTMHSTREERDHWRSV